MRNTRFRSLLTLFLAALAAISLAPPTLAALHDIPSVVTARVFLKPEGQNLKVLVRVPLESMRDFNFPVTGPGFLQLDQVDPLLYEAAQMWLVDYLELYENGRPLVGEVTATRISLPSDGSFSTYDETLAHVLGPKLPVGTEIVWQQAMLDVVVDYPIQSASSEFSIRSGLAHLGISTTTILHYLPPDAPERVYQFTGDLGVVRLDPSWAHAAFSFVKMGFQHILGGIDHILFVLLLVIPVRRVVPLIGVITAFTVAHSVTLIASALGFAPTTLWFPPFIEMLIALSIVFMAFENVVGASIKRRWLIAFGFGLIHGFGFSFLLRESLQFAGGHLFTSLLAFNIGVELGQILVVAVAVPALALLFKYVDRRLGTLILSGLVAHSAWHWMTERYAEFAQHQIQMPVMNAAFLADLMRWIMGILIVGLAAWGLYGLFGRAVDRHAAAGPPEEGEPVGPSA